MTRPGAYLGRLAIMREKNTEAYKLTLWSTKFLSQEIKIFQKTTLKILQVLTVVFTIWIWHL